MLLSNTAAFAGFGSNPGSVPVARGPLLLAGVVRQVRLTQVSDLGCNLSGYWRIGRPQASAKSHTVAQGPACFDSEDDYPTALSSQG